MERLAADLSRLVHEAVDPLRSDIKAVSEKVENLGREVSQLCGKQTMVYDQVKDNAKVASGVIARIAKVEGRLGINGGPSLIASVADAIRRPGTLVALVAVILAAVVISAMSGAIDLMRILQNLSK